MARGNGGGPPVDFGKALNISGVEKPIVKDIKADVAVAIECQCPAKQIIITRLSQPSACPHCRTGYPVIKFIVQPMPDHPELLQTHVEIGKQEFKRA